MKRIIHAMYCTSLLANHISGFNLTSIHMYVLTYVTTTDVLRVKRINACMLAGTIAEGQVAGSLFIPSIPMTEFPFYLSLIC